MELRLHHFEPHSQSNGPGTRAVVWVQGCTLGCPDCFNPETHGSTQGETWQTQDLAQKILNLEPGIDGLTLSGGEPLQQRQPVESLLQEVHNESPLSVVLFTGFTWDEIQRMPRIQSLLNHVDVLIAGRYQAERRIAHSLIGSSNKSVHFLTDRYSLADLEPIPEAEVIIEPNGEIHLSGINPLTW